MRVALLGDPHLFVCFAINFAKEAKKKLQHKKGSPIVSARDKVKDLIPEYVGRKRNLFVDSSITLSRISCTLKSDKKYRVRYRRDRSQDATSWEYETARLDNKTTRNRSAIAQLLYLPFLLRN